VKTFIKLAIGYVLNALGFPAIVRECKYGGELGNQVTVRKTTLYTIITVNGVDVYFTRLTGAIDGTGMVPTADANEAGS